MNTREYRVFIVILIICAAVVLVYTYGVKPHPTTVTTTSVTNAPANSVVIPLSVVTIHEDGLDVPQVNVEYPQFSSLPTNFNDSISSSTLNRLSDFRKTVDETTKARLATGGRAGEIATSSYTFMASWQSSQINARYVSFLIRYDSYSGGANENQDLETFNYSIASGTPVTLEQLFPDVPNRLNIISQLVRKELRASLSAVSPGYQPDAMLAAGTQPTEDSFSRFTFTDDTITFYFPKYAVAPGVFGEQKVTLPRSAIK